MPSNDEARLRHILDAAEELSKFLENKTEQELENDRLLQLALQKLIEIIGEAANQLSTDLKEKHPNIKWRLAVATRNRLSHGYFDIDTQIIWSTAKVDVPEFAAQIMHLMNPRGGTQKPD